MPYEPSIDLNLIVNFLERYTIIRVSLVGLEEELKCNP